MHSLITLHGLRAEAEKKNLGCAIYPKKKKKKLTGLIA
jgi:hypothetical protein